MEANKTFNLISAVDAYGTCIAIHYYKIGGIAAAARESLCSPIQPTDSHDTSSESDDISETDASSLARMMLMRG